MEVIHSAIAGLSAVLVVGIIVWGISSCSQREDALRRTCIQAGGSAVAAPGGSFNCIRGGGSATP